MSTLQELFDREPTELSEDDLDVMVKYLQEQRSKFKLKEAEEKKPRKKKAEIIPLDLSQFKF